MTELLVGTKKGLFAIEGEPGGPMRIVGRAFPGEPVEIAMRHPRTGRLLAAVTSPFYGPKIWHAADVSGPWEQAQGLELPAGADAALARIWTIVAGAEGELAYAGGDPGVLFASGDGGRTWELDRGLWEQPTRPDWEPGGGGLCLHAIAPWPGDPRRLTVAMSATGVWHTDDGGATWRHGNGGLAARYLPEDAREETLTLCVHALQRAPRRPERLFLQFHGGVYRSDDAGATWVEVGDGLPSDFGFPLVVDPADPDSAYVIPLKADIDRVTPDGRVRVYETRDGGATWRARGDGLPSRDAYLTVLRQAFDRAGAGADLELYFGTTTGELYGSADAGATWAPVAVHLPPIHSVRATERAS